MRRNWAGNYIYHAPRLYHATSIADMQDVIASAGKVRVLGTRHSFNAIADSDELQLSLRAMDRVISLDAKKRQVTVQGGIRYGDLAPVLHRRGFALANLASLPHISIAGAVATGTHGSGSGMGNLATSVAALEMVTADGQILCLSREADGERFNGAVVSLGALGAVAKLTLDIEPTYDVRQIVYTGLPFDTLEAEFDAVMSAGNSVSVFTDWRGQTVNSVWIKQRVAGSMGQPAADLLGAPAATRKLHPLPGGTAGDCTEQLGQPGRWHERLPHFRMEFTPSNGAEIQAEYFLPRGMAAQAIMALRGFGERLAPALMASEIRTIAKDDLWLSPCNRGDSVAFHFTFHRDWEAIRAVLPDMEASLAELGAVPHWGKVTMMEPAYIRSSYARLPEFRALMLDCDPTGKFRNAFVDRLIMGEGRA